MVCLTANTNSMAENAAATDTDEYFKAVEDGDLQKVKELFREKRVKVDSINKVLCAIYSVYLSKPLTVTSSSELFLYTRLIANLLCCRMDIRLFILLLEEVTLS